jgi:two-component system LytT family response regulator
MIEATLRVVIADDERPARAFLASILRPLSNVKVVAEATGGAEAIQLIERHRPDLVFLDLQMPEVDGLTVMRLIRRRFLPLVIFVTAFDEFAVKAFELNAVDYVTKPVSPARLRAALARARERLDSADLKEAATDHMREALISYEKAAPAPRLDRIPVRHNDDILLVPVSRVASIVAEGELLHLTTLRMERHTITYRLKDLESRLDPVKFIRLGRGVLANIDAIVRVTPMPGGFYTVRLQNGQELGVSRVQSRILRARLLHL